MKTALILSTYNRPEYLQRCVDSLLQLDRLPDIVIVIDDCSTDNKVPVILSDFTAKYKGSIERHQTSKNTGIKGVLKLGYDMAFALGYDIAINLDADAIVKPNLISRLVELKTRFPKCIVSGFNSLNKKSDGGYRNPIIREGEDYFFKKHCNGINMCIDRVLYNNVVYGALSANGNWDFNCTTEYPVVIAKPSVVEHIGLKSSMGHDKEEPDTAWDYERIKLDKVTLFGIDGRSPDGILKAAERSQKKIDFADAKIITESLFTGKVGYSKFCIEKMNSYIDTEFVLVIQPDGFILNPDGWDNTFMEYDYIGAPWPYSHLDVGNGGFSLRSKKLLDILARHSHQFEVQHPEDAVICRYYRDWLENRYGIKFAPRELAEKFSLEAYGAKSKVYNGQFGFHGGNIDFSLLPSWARPYDNNGITKYHAIEKYLQERQKRIGKKRRW